MFKFISLSIYIITLAAMTAGGTVYAVEDEDIQTHPIGYEKLNWIGEEGITSYMKKPTSVGYIDYITIIDLTKNRIEAKDSVQEKTINRPAVAPFQSPEVQDWIFAKEVVETFKKENKEAEFLWNAPFFSNVAGTSTLLSLGLKSADEEGTYITSGARIESDVAQSRRMLIINNANQQAKIVNFDTEIFIQEGDQAVEGFHPLDSPDFKGGSASRLFLGVRNNGKELVVYCSKSAMKQEASAALSAAGVPVSEQIHFDGGGSAACGYNLPGQYFVEPGRPLPHVMVAIPSLKTGIITINNLNVRTGPGTSNPAVRKLAIGTEVVLYETQGDWVRISETEWVHSGYVRINQSFPYAGEVTINNLNVRTGPGTEHAVVRQLAVGEKVNVQEQKEGWLKISEFEWVFGGYVK